MKHKVLFDTDIGSDIDDAVCLAYLLANPQCDLLGITTVSGEALKRAQLASAVCRAAGREVPIYPGAEVPFLIDQPQPEAPQAAALPRWDHAAEFPRGEAVSFLRDTIRRHPGEITLLAVGPFTNVGLLFASDPEIPGLLKQFVLMGGVFAEPALRERPREWNAQCDPHATAIAYHHAVPRHASVGLDVTLRVRMAADDVRRRFTAPVLQPVLDFADAWFARCDHITFHDPLAAVTLFEPDVCTFTRGRVTVDLASASTAGATRWQADADGPHEVALEVDPDRFFEHYFSVFQDT